MSSTNTSSNRICPECGHANASFSLFCAECGTSLTDADQPDDTGQTTALFTPLTDVPESTTPIQGSPDDRFATQEFTPQAVPPGGTRQDAMAGWYTPPPAASHANEPMESRRGFWLGIVATILILVVIGFFGWSTLASDGFRDSITGIF